MRPLSAAFESGAQSYEGGGSKVWIGSQTTTKTTVKNASRPPIPAISGVISIRSRGWRCQPRGMAPGALGLGLVRHQFATGGGAIASATLSVSCRLRSAVLLKIVIPMFTICTIPERTIIAPKIPRAM